MKKLFKVTNGIGDYWIIAKDPTEAEEKLLKLLNDKDYGFIKARPAVKIEVIATQSKDMLTGHFLII